MWEREEAGPEAMALRLVLTTILSLDLILRVAESYPGD